MPIYPGFDICTFTAHFKRTTTQQKWSNAFYWKAASSNLTASNVVDGCEAFKTQLGAVICPLMHESCILTNVSARIFISGGLIDGTSTSSANTGALGDQECLPLSSVVVVQKKTTVFGRSARGRYFFAGIGEEMNNGGFVDVTFNTRARALASFLGASRTFVVPFDARHWNRKINTFQPISACVTLDKISTLRSRTKKERGAPV